MPTLSSRQLAPGTSTIGRWPTAFRAGLALLFLFLAGTVPAPAQTNAFPEFKSETARVYWTKLAELMGGQVGTNAEGCFCLARLQGLLGEKGEAERLARKALQMEPGRSKVVMFLADILIRQDRMQEAAACLREALRANPRLKGGQRQLGMVLERLGDRQGAREAFALAVEVDPADAGAWLLRGKSLLDEGKLKEAVADLERSCQLDPASANAYYPLFQAQTKLGNREAAQAALKTFQELKKVEKSDQKVGILTDLPMDNEAALRAFTSNMHRATAEILFKEGNAPAAEEHLRQALRVAPGEPETYELLAQICVQKGQLAEAATNLQELVRRRPTAPADHANLGTLLLQLKDYDGAVAELKRALELEPTQPAALHNLARFYLTGRRDLPEALTLSRRLVEADPSAASYDLLGWAYYANGKTNEAIAATAEAVKRDPGNKAYSSRLRRLQELAGTK